MECITYMHRIVLLEAVGLIGLSHQNHDGSNTAEQAMAGSLVCFPCRVEARQSIEESIFIDNDLFGHRATGCQANVRFSLTCDLPV